MHGTNKLINKIYKNFKPSSFTESKISLWKYLNITHRIMVQIYNKQVLTIQRLHQTNS